MDDFGTILLFLFIGIIGFLFYFLPSILGFVRHQPNKTAILILNIFLGWSFIGWIVALVWAFKKEAQPVQVVNNYNPPTQPPMQ
ncbi:MAG: superinfection immunity protein [Candidatus Fimenecus sp.]